MIIYNLFAVNLVLSTQQFTRAFPGMAVVFIAWESASKHSPTIILIEADVETAIFRFRLPYPGVENGVTPEIEQMVGIFLSHITIC